MEEHLLYGSDRQIRAHFSRPSFFRRNSRPRLKTGFIRCEKSHRNTQPIAPASQNSGAKTGIDRSGFLSKFLELVLHLSERGPNASFISCCLEGCDQRVFNSSSSELLWPPLGIGSHSMKDVTEIRQYFEISARTFDAWRSQLRNDVENNSVGYVSFSLGSHFGLPAGKSGSTLFLPDSQAHSDC
jgi:hypothetical protein